MKRFIIALTLTCVFASPSFAGDVPTIGIAPPPPPPPSDGMQATTAPGEIPSGGFTYEIADTALDFIQLVLGAGI